MADSNNLRNMDHAQEEIPEELEVVKQWWNAHGNIVTIVLIALLVVILACKQFKSYNANRQVQAFAELRTAGNEPDKLETIIREAKSSAVVPLARLRLAQANYMEEHYDLALNTYNAFLKDTPTHELADIAAVGKAHCLEALGKLDEAQAAYAAFADERSDSFIYPDARIGQARCLILKGTEESKREGKQILDMFLADWAGTEWTYAADELIHAINRLKPAAPKAIDLDAFMNGTLAPEAESAPEPIVVEAAATPEA